MSRLCCMKVEHVTPPDIERIAERVVSSAHAQAEGLDEAARQVSSIADLVDDNLSRVGIASVSVDLALRSAQRGRQEVESLMHHGEQLEEISAHLDRSVEALAMIRQRASVLQDIAEQSRIVALNASVEATRAGTRGVVFASVAQMMRELAKRTAQAAVDIAEVVATHLVSMEASKDRSAGYIRRNREAAARCSSAFADISSSVAGMAESLDAVVALSRQQADVVDAVKHTITARVEENSREVSQVVDLLHGTAVTELSPQECAARLPTFQVIDVRTPKEHAAEYEPLPGAILLPLRRDFDERLAALDRSRAYLFVCRTGGRSARAARVAIGLGFRSSYTVEGGMRGLDELGQGIVKAR